MESRGLILVNTGPGKGKTTAALGTACRALGQGLKVAFLQFVKSRETGESRFLEACALDRPSRLFYRRLGLGFLKDKPTEADRAKAREALELARRVMAEDYDLVVLDEICVALDRGLLETAEVLTLLRDRPKPLHVMLTGRGCPGEIIALADTATEMTVLKHAYQAGLPAVKGLEY